MASWGIRGREIASALIWALAAAVATFFLSLPGAAVMAGWGGLLGYLTGCALAQTRLRWLAVSGLLLSGYLLVKLLVSQLTGSYLMASMLGAESAYTLAQWINWGGQFYLLTAFLRFVSGRYHGMVSAEILTVTLLFASPLAAHRDGFINRPYFLVDPLWSRNLDPVPVLFALGAVAAALLIVLQMGRRTRRASGFDALLLFVLISLLYAFLPARQLLDFDIRDPLGAKGKGKEGKSQNSEQEMREAQLREQEEGKKRESQGQGGGRSEAEEMELDRSEDEQKQKQKPVAIVLLRDDYNPLYGYYYFRQTAFSQYNGKRLVADTTGKTDRDLLDGYPTQRVQVPSTVPLDSRFHKRLPTFTAMIQGTTKPFTMVDGVQVEPAANPNPSQFVRAYESESLVIDCSYEQMFPLQSGDPSWSPEVQEHYLKGPADPRYRELAQKCVDQLPEEYRQSDFARAVAIKLYLDKTMTYTMKARYEGIEDPVSHYLFQLQRGYCVHQAHAAVFLWRSLGLPSRVGAGYATDARNRGNGSAILLRSGEAHAWPEVYLHGAGWVILDISPEKAEGGEMDQPDPNLQRLLGELARMKEKRPPEEEERFGKRSLQEIFRGLLLVCWAVGKWLLLGMAVANYAYKFFRRFEPLWCGPKRLPVAALRSAQDQLAEVGAIRAYGEGRLEFARRLQLESLEPLTYRHLASTLGPQGVAEDHSKEILQLREKVHQQIARRYPWWRRLLGFLHPLSWWNSR